MRTIVKISIVLFLSIFLLNISEAQFARYIYLFLVNSGSFNSLSEVNATDINNVVEVARHYTVPSGYYGNPSRTAIDREGNAWVGNRATNTLVKIGNYGRGTCVDRNGNGKIDTNLDTNRNGVIDSEEMVYDINSDECVLQNVVLSYGTFHQLVCFSCCGCHCSWAVSGTHNFQPPLKLPKGVRKIRIWCSEAYGEELCLFRLKIDGQWISRTGSYDFGTISGKYASSGCCSGSNFEVCGLSYTTLGSNIDWRNNDIWGPCDVCDFHIELEFNLNRDVYLEAIDYYSDDSMIFYTDVPIIRQLGDGEGVRAVCVDEQNNVYGGMFAEKRLYKVDKDGNILKVIDLGDCNPYGCAVDKNGLVWVSCVLQRAVVKYDPKTDSISRYGYPWAVYGISPTAVGDGLVINGWEHSIVWKIDLNGNIVWQRTGPYQGRGITVDKEDNVYAVGSRDGDVYKYDKNGNLLRTRVGVCSQPTGIGLDYNENVWVACYGDGRIVALNKDTLEIITSKVIGAYHYVYSDWTGYILHQIVAPISDIIIPIGLFELLELLLSPLMILIVFSAGIAYYVESRAKAGGYAFLFVFSSMLLAFAIFTDLIPKWVIILVITIFIGGIMLVKR